MGIPAVPDFARLAAQRHARLQSQLEAQSLDGLLLLGTNPVVYATGAEIPGADSARAGLLRPVAAVVRGEDRPHLFSPYGFGPYGQDESTADSAVRHDPLYLECDDGLPAAARALGELFGPRARVAVDELTRPMLEGLAGFDFVSANAVLGPARVVKTPDELACIRRAQRLNEEAMVRVYEQLGPGVRQSDLSAVFLRTIFELGATGNGIDPIWQVMPASHAEGPWTTHGDVAFPTPSSDRVLREGDVVWVDTGIDWHGYASDFGRTWLVGHDPRPSARQQAQFERWCAVMTAVLDILGPGVSALDLGEAATAANGGRRPWIEHFYLAHGVGTESAEMPLVGTDLGTEFDRHLVMEPGMVLVLEPVIWDDGAAGYRSEDIFAVTDDGWVALSDHPYAPFEGERPW